MTTLPHVSLAFAFLMGLHFGLTYFVDEKDRQCPHISHRKFRIQSVCNGSSRVYTCLYNTNNKAYDEFCKNNQQVRAGLKYVISGTFRNVRCSEQRYQPITFSSNQGSDCLYSKSQCNEAGQIVVDNKSSIGDSKCRCDYTRNFAFVSRTRNSCFCTPSEEDCTCYIKHCPKYTALSPDYECLSLNSTNKKFNCKFITQARANGSLTTTLIKGRKTKDRKVTTISTITGSSSTFIPLFVVLTVLVIVGLVGIIVLRKCNCKRNQANVLEQRRSLFPHQQNISSSDKVVNGNQHDNLDNGVSKNNSKDPNKITTDDISSKYDSRQHPISSNKGCQNGIEEIVVKSAEVLPNSIHACSNRKINIMSSSYEFEDPDKKSNDDISNKYDSRQDAFSSNKGCQNKIEEIEVESAEELPYSIQDFSKRKRNIMSSSYEFEDSDKKTNDDISSKYDSRQHPISSNKGCQNEIEEIEVESAEVLPNSMPAYSDQNRDIFSSSCDFKDEQHSTTTNYTSSDFNFFHDLFSSDNEDQNEIEEIEVEIAAQPTISIPDCFYRNREILSSSFDLKDQNQKNTDDNSSNYDFPHDVLSSDKVYQNQLEELAVESAEEPPKSITAYFGQNNEILSFCDYSSGHHMKNGELLNDQNDTLNIHQAENLDGQQQKEIGVELAPLDETSVHSPDRCTVQLTERSLTFVTLVSEERFDPGKHILSSSWDYSFGHHMSQAALSNDENDTMSNQAENLERHQPVQDNVELTQVKTLDEASIQHDSTNGYTPQLTEQRFTPVTQDSDGRFDLGRDILYSSCDNSSGHQIHQPAPQITINTNTWHAHEMENLERHQEVQYNAELEEVETSDESSIQYDSIDRYTLTEQLFTPVTQVSGE